MATSQSQLFTGSGTFNVPANVSLVFVSLVGGGGSGGPGAHGSSGASGGGGAGEFCRRMPVKVTPGAAITVTIGAGGVSPASGASIGNQGGTTSFGTVLYAQGGYGGAGNFSLPNGELYCRGGGTRGGQFGIGNPWGLSAVIGNPESPSYFGGSSGGGEPGPGSITGGTCEGYPGATGGTTVSGAGGGSGGGSSCFGVGGTGANGSATDFANDGNPAPASSYGAGGGGAGGCQDDAEGAGGDGADGACLVEWIA